ncbi:MAG: hypothetical protein ABW022_11040 [Actinoplanes sp.]
MNRISNKLWTPDLVVPTKFATTPKRGMELVDMRALGIVQSIFGAANRLGTHVAADVVTQTADGTDLNSVWRDFMALLNEVNGSRQALINFLIWPVTNPTDTVTQPGQGVDFEEATEFGEPVGSRIQPTYFQMGYGFKWYDLASRYTWQYLADATDEMVNSVANAAVEAYYRKLMFEVLKTAFNPTNLTATIRGNAYNVYKFYNADGTIPPTYKNNVFNGSHTHFKTSGTNSVLEAQDLDTLVIDDFASHGYTQADGYRLVVMANTALGNQIRNFRSAVNTNQAVGGNYGRYDFIPAQGQPGQIIPATTQVIGASQPANTLNGLSVIGSYGPLLIVVEDWMPTDYAFAFATGGSESLQNPIGLREHAQTGLRGLRLVKGRNADYPLIDSFWAAGFGTGVRQRGAGIVVQLTSSAYSAPAVYA